MKYTILGFQQDKANDLKLNMNDLLLMRTIKDMYSSAGMEYVIEDGDKYIWAKQDYLHEQIPIIGSKRTMLRIIDKLVELKLLEKKIKHRKGNVKGTFFYIKPTVKMDRLEDYEPYDKVSRGGRQSVKGGMTKRHSKDTSITDTSIKDTKDIVEQSSQSDKSDDVPYKEIVDHLNKKADRQFRHTTNKTKSLIKARFNEGFELDDFKQVIDVKVAEWEKDNEMNKFLRPETLFGTKFESYLNQPVKHVKKERDWSEWKF